LPIQPCSEERKSGVEGLPLKLPGLLRKPFLERITWPGNSISFAYDGDGNRVKETRNGAVTIYIGDYYDRKGSQLRNHYYIGGRLVAVYRSGFGSKNRLFYIHTDHLSSTAITTRSDGAFQAELRYKAYGETRYYTAGQQVTPHRFTGQLWESSTGLYFYRSRWGDQWQCGALRQLARDWRSWPSQP